ncbi:NAD(P)H-hydrate dehydratase [Ruegeria jejuensis]|uniref:NAD(P)H-hydrate dehydratase n=1 Tax=Ruegeria jejuensis TaxID=3233338 RepID=UPI00355B9BEB
MSELLTAAQMRAIEQAAIDSGEVTGLELMERAGQGVVEAIFEEWPELAESVGRAVVLCGPGNNGGDGFVVARLLKERGWEVEVFLYGDPEKLPPDARVNYDRWSTIGAVSPLADFKSDRHSPVQLCTGVWIIDALFGTGLTRPIEGELAEILQPLAEMELGARGAIVSVDIPSGICSDSGRPLGLALPSELAVSFHLPKCGHHLATAANGCVSLKIAPIGLPSKWPHPTSSQVLLENDNDGMGTWVFCGKDRTPQDEKTVHKYSHGHALILSGGAGKTGAARLAARGALRIGSGLVTLGVPPSAQMEVAGQITSLMLRRVEGGDGLAELLSDERLNALCLGPGLGLERARDLVPGALKSARATVLDADALSGFADAPDALFAMLHESCVLTPHGGEFARLFPDISRKLNAVPTKGPAYSKVDATREAAKRAGCVVLFKGPDTVIAAPDGRCSVNSAHYERAAPWLATAGSGDVLAGFITGLLARGFAPMQAAETGAWLHVECARHFGPGLIAEDLPEQLPAVFRELGL